MFFTTIVKEANQGVRCGVMYVMDVESRLRYGSWGLEWYNRCKLFARSVAEKVSYSHLCNTVYCTNVTFATIIARRRLGVVFIIKHSGTACECIVKSLSRQKYLLIPTVCPRKYFYFSVCKKSADTS